MIMCIGFFMLVIIFRACCFALIHVCKYYLCIIYSYSSLFEVFFFGYIGNLNSHTRVPYQLSFSLRTVWSLFTHHMHKWDVKMLWLGHFQPKTHTWNGVKPFHTSHLKRWQDSSPFIFFLPAMGRWIKFVIWSVLLFYCTDRPQVV